MSRAQKAMSEKAGSIPVNHMLDEADTGISIERMFLADSRIRDNTGTDDLAEGKQSHRHDAHSFHLLEEGTLTIEIDFQIYKLKAASIIYIHPDQVHRTSAFKNVTVSSWAISSENLNPDYLARLKDITPAKPLRLPKETFSILHEAVSLCIKFSGRKNDKLHHALLKDSCNALVALFLSQYLEQSKPAEKLTRFDAVTKAFRDLLERNYITLKRPAEYARKLNVSASYLNECVKAATGYPVTYHIQQRVVLEAKRLLYHSGKTVKEIAGELGYDDYPYFTRLFTKTAGMTALAFRNKNRK